MHAIEITETGGPEVLNYVEKSKPAPGPGEVLIKAEAIGVNFLDTYFRSGLYPRETPFVVGNEVCGTVEAVGQDVAALKVGDRVVTAQANGAYAEYSVAAADFCAYVPDGVSPEVAAASLLKGMTAHYLIKSTYPVQQGDAVLLHAGAGGVGLILTQWATSMAARVITTVSTPEKAEMSRNAGAVEVLDYPDAPAEFGAKIKELTEGGVSVVYDGVGAATFDASLASLAVRGTLALFGASSGPVPPFDPQRLNTSGSVFLTRPTLVHYTRTPDEFAWRAGELLEAIANGTLNITVSERYRLEDAETAHRDLEGRKTIGSVVLVP
ncbi:NADPH:quinone reductase [Mycolicibacterium elephantis]|uniref:quinone oxidoreductase family protein n=1 Tax=Mycolicibacterium elephantis TaxID=81858 RepID=UPI0007EB09EE|nr:quinone oxidoreductase [Mycolicibacterium elephantis]OBA90140.1 NADPH:quinone reductase [Mycolicibacterium elephantis]